MTSHTQTPSTKPLRRTSLQRHRITSWIALAAASLALAAVLLLWWQHSGRQGLETFAAATGNPYDLMEWVGPNGDLEGLLAESEIVVVGQFTEVGEVKLVLPNGYDPNAGHLPPGQSPAVAFTDLAFRVDDYLKGDGPKVLTVAQTGDLKKGDGPAEFPKPKLNDTMMLFLTREEERGDNVWASNRGPFGRVLPVNGKLVFPTAINREVSFLAGKSFDQVKAEVRAKAR